MIYYFSLFNFLVEWLLMSLFFVIVLEVWFKVFFFNSEVKLNFVWIVLIVDWSFFFFFIFLILLNNEINLNDLFIKFE